MKRYLPACLATLSIALVLGCQYFRLPERLESEVATENTKPTLDDALVFLNSEPSGRISDIGQVRDPLSRNLGVTGVDKRLKEIMDQRELNGVFVEDSNIVANNVYLVAEPELSIAAFAKLFLGLDKSAGTVYIPKNANPPPPDTPEKPNPYTLIIRTTAPIGRLEFPPNWPIYDPDYKVSYDIEVEIAKSGDQLKSTRMWEDSFEISADERFFVNEKQGPDADHGPRFSRVKQRPIEEAQIKSEIDKLPPGSEGKLLIISEKASYGSLLRVLELFNGSRTRFQIVVRPNEFLDREP